MSQNTTQPLTEDWFLGEQLRLLQPRDGYRAGVDPVLLAAAVPARPGESVLDLGCGVGTVALCLGRRVPGISLTGVDLLAENLSLARRNAAENALEMECHQGDVAALPVAVRQRSFHHVVANPPYFRRGAGPASSTDHRDAAMASDAPLEIWIDCGIKRLSPKGRLSMIMAAARLPELLSAIGPRLGDLRVLPIVGRAGRVAGRVIVSGRKDSRAPFELLPPLILHSEVEHARDADDFTDEATAILRGGAAILLDNPA